VKTTYKVDERCTLRVETPKPLSERPVVVPIIDQHIGSNKYNIHAVAVGETFKERAQLRRHCPIKTYENGLTHEANKNLQI